MSSHLTRAGIILILSASLPVGTAGADSITDQIDAARRAYENGEPRVAIQALEFAAEEIKVQLTAEQLKVLPDPLPGWSAEDPESQTPGFAQMIAGTNLTRRYANAETGQRVEITITADSPLLGMMGMMLGSPMMMQAAGGNTRPFSFEGHRGTIEQDPDAGTVKVALMIGTRILLQIEGSLGADRQTLEAYLKAMDLKALEKALLG
jgi:hypothetical protein